MGDLKAKIEESGGFKHWFVNSFWYHNKWVVLVAVAIVTIVVYITVDAVSQENYDAMVVVASRSYLTEDNLTELNEVLASGCEDLNGDGEVTVYCTIVYTGEGDLGTSSQERMYLYMTDSDYVIYLMDASVASVYADPDVEYFTDALEDYDLEAMDNNPYLMDVSDNPVLQRAGFETMYLAIMDYSTKSDDEEAAQRTENALNMIQALLDAE